MTTDIPPILREPSMQIGPTVIVSVQRILDYQNRCEERIGRQLESIDRLLARIEELENTISLLQNPTTNPATVVWEHRIAEVIPVDEADSTLPQGEQRPGHVL